MKLLRKRPLKINIVIEIYTQTDNMQLNKHLKVLLDVFSPPVWNVMEAQ